MQRNNLELWLAFLCIVMISAGYFAVVRLLGGIPPARELFGHSLGVIGLLLMLMTETLYSIRKRSRSARWGRPAAWLKFHIFTGIVGPFLALLHTAWKFNGLAGLVILMTCVVVFSGFVGRYIYTAIPRKLDGTELEEEKITEEIVRLQGVLNKWLMDQPDSLKSLSKRISSQPIESGTLLIFGGVWQEFQLRYLWQRETRHTPRAERSRMEPIRNYLIEEMRLGRQKKSIAAARRLLGLWHSIHIPLGMVLFTTAIIHVAAAVYYATLLK